MLNIPDLATQWGHIFGGVNQIDTFRGSTLVTRGNTISADYTTAAEQRIVSEGLYQKIQEADTGLNDITQFLFDMAKNTLAYAAIQDSNFPIATDEDTLIDKLLDDMIAQAQTFQLPTVQVDGSAVSASSVAVTTLEGAPFGNGTIVLSVIEPRTAVVKYYTYPEVIRFTCVADSYVDGATAGQETFLVQSYASVDSLNSLWPKGSGVNTTYQSAGSNVGTTLANAYFDNWDQTTANTILSWTTQNLTPGTTITQSTDPYVGLYAVQLTAAPLNAELTQTVSGLLGSQNYLAAIRVKRATVITGGVLTVALRDSSGNILNDAAGNPLSFTVSLTGASGSYFLTNKVFSVPRGFATGTQFSLKITTAMNAAESVRLATAELIPMQSLYVGGPDCGFLPGSQGWARDDQYISTLTNTATKATFVRVVDRLYNTRAKAVDLPVALVPTISDGLIV